MSRRDDLNRFYRILDDLRKQVGGCRELRHCTSKSGWPERGVYFFFENGELREDRNTARIVRVGTHAITATSKTTLWNRLHTHRGHSDRGGNHRGSIFRKRIGEAMLNSRSYRDEIARSWGIGSSASREITNAELPLEQDVSDYIGTMPLLWLGVDDAPSPVSLRSYLERNSIALLSNFRKDPVDPPSINWLGTKSSQVTISSSGLWNTNHVEEKYESRFLDVFQEVLLNLK